MIQKDTLDSETGSSPSKVHPSKKWQHLGLSDLLTLQHDIVFYQSQELFSQVTKLLRASERAQQVALSPPSPSLTPGPTW